MIVPFAQHSISGSSKLIAATVLARTCRPTRIVAPDYVDESIHVSRISYVWQAKRHFGPWWPEGTSAPLALFKVSAANKVALDVDMPVLVKGTLLEVHLVNVNPAMRWTMLSFEAISANKMDELISGESPVDLDAPPSCSECHQPFVQLSSGGYVPCSHKPRTATP